MFNLLKVKPQHQPEPVKIAWSLLLSSPKDMFTKLLVTKQGELFKASVRFIDTTATTEQVLYQGTDLVTALAVAKGHNLLPQTREVQALLRYAESRGIEVVATSFIEGCSYQLSTSSIWLETFWDSPYQVVKGLCQGREDIAVVLAHELGHALDHRAETLGQDVWRNEVVAWRKARQLWRTLFGGLPKEFYAVERKALLSYYREKSYHKSLKK